MRRDKEEKMEREKSEKEATMNEKAAEKETVNKKTGTDKEAELLNDLQRTRADFENYRKQIEVQKENERKSTRLLTVMKILPLLDDIERAISAYEELKPLEKSLGKTLKELSLTKIPSEPGTEFDPDLHEAVTMEGEGERQVISETLRPGYYYEAEVLRPAMVKVSSGSAS